MMPLYLWWILSLAAPASAQTVIVVPKFDAAGQAISSGCPCPKDDVESALLLKDVFSKYRIKPPLDLSAYGLFVEPQGNWVKKTDGSFANKEELSRAVESSLLDSYKRGSKEALAAWLGGELKERLPSDAAAIDSLSTPAKAALLQYLLENPRAICRGLTGFATRLNAATNSEAFLGVLSDAFDHVDGISIRLSEDLLDRTLQDPSAISITSQADKYSDNLSLVRNLPQELRSRLALLLVDEFKPRAITLKINAPPPMILTKIKYSSVFELDVLLGDIKKRSDDEIATLKNDLLSLSAFNDPKITSNAVYLLGRFQDPALTGLFKDKLQDDAFFVREQAATSLGSLIGALKSDGLDGLVNKGPALLSIVASTRNQHPYNAAGGIIRDYMGQMNLMSERQRVLFIQGFDDPVTLAVIFSMSRGEDINERTGIHTPEGKALYAKIKALAKARGRIISNILKDPGMSSEARANFLVRANRYQVLEDAVKEDPHLVAVAAEIAFDGRMDEGTSSVLKTMERALDSKFHGILLTHAKAATNLIQKARMLIFLKLNESKLTQPQKTGLQEASLGTFSKDFLEQLKEKNENPLPYYSTWPKNRFNVYLAMTQKEWASEFRKTLQASGYDASSSRPGMGSRWTKRVASKEVNILLKVFEANKTGWAQNAEHLTQELKRFLENDEFQIVIYRGHSGNYNSESLKNSLAKDKVFIDLSCDSNFNRHVISKCENCGFFGTLTTAQGIVNSRFLLTILESMAREERCDQMQKRLEKTLPNTYHKFSGDCTFATRYDQHVTAFLKSEQSILAEQSLLGITRH